MGSQKKDEMRITMRECDEDSQYERRSVRLTGGAVFDGLSQNSHSLSPAITWENRHSTNERINQQETDLW